MQLYKVAFIVAFAGGKNRSFSQTIRRMILLLSTALLIGLTLAWQLPPLPNFQNISHFTLFFTIVILSQMIVSITLCLAYGLLRHHYREGLARMLLVLPVKKEIIWIILILPSIILGSICLAVFGPPLYVLANDLGLQPLVGLLAMVVGFISAVGLTYGIPAKYYIFHFAMIAVIFMIQYLLLKEMWQLISAHGKAITAVWTAMGIVILITFSMLIYSAKHLPRAALLAAQNRRVRFNFLTSTWHLKKIIRSPVTSLGFIATMCMSFTLASTSYILNAADIALFGTLCALLAAAFTSDLRVNTRRYYPIEIAGIRGSNYYCFLQILWGGICATLAVSPLLLATYSHIDSVQQLLVPLSLGITAGLFASTLLSPQPRDVTAQIIATLLSIAILFLPSTPLISTWVPVSSTVIKMSLCLMLLILIFVIEYKRNPYYWRDKHAS